MAMRSCSIDLAPRGVTCIVINPGWVKTDMGGANARITPETSISAMRKVIERLTLKDSGRFFNWDGKEYPW
jgi:NAD(P)-dependent dehydrogenase (short-subunit alcohol dehydrogenase family)